MDACKTIQIEISSSPEELRSNIPVNHDDCAAPVGEAATAPVTANASIMDAPDSESKCTVRVNTKKADAVPEPLTSPTRGIKRKEPDTPQAPLDQARVAPEAVAVEHLRQDLPVLIVEDNPTTQKVMQKMLDRLGCKRTDSALNGKQALERATSKLYRVIFMDYQLPFLDGCQVTEALRKAEEERGLRLSSDDDVKPPSSAPTFIVGVTGDSTGCSKERCLQSGMNAFLAKPVNLRQLESMIDEYFRWAGLAH